MAKIKTSTQVSVILCHECGNPMCIAIDEGSGQYGFSCTGCAALFAAITDGAVKLTIVPERKVH